MSEQFCLIPEGGLNISPNGDITPCCIITNPVLGHITTDSIESVFYGKEYTEFRQVHRNGNLPDICVKNCVEKHNNFVHREGRSRLIKLAELDKLKEVGKEKLITIDIGLGNVCNLICVFCNDHFSSSWAKLNNTDKIYKFDLDTTLNVAKNLKGLTFLSFKGGEPLNIPYLDKFLEELYKNNPDCTLSMITNGTEINEKIRQAFFKFKTTISISIEATGLLYQYLRGGRYTYENVLDNIKKFYDSGCREITISSIISLYNYTRWAEDMYKIQTDIRKFATELNELEFNAQLCVFPIEQNLFLLNRDQRQRLIDSILYYVNKGLVISGLTPMLETIMEERAVDVTKEQVLENIEFNNKLRNMNLFSIIEDFTPHLTV